MDRPAVGALAFRDEQRQQWDQAARGWRKWSRLIETASHGVSERLVDMAGARLGSRVLDVGTGYGEPALTAARTVGPTGRVVATDSSSEMLAFGRERAAEAQLHNVDFVAADAASLDFPPHSFDAVVSRWAIIFEPDPEAVARRLGSFLRPGGRVAISSWGPPDRVPYVAIPMATAAKRLKIQLPPVGAPGPFSRSTPESLRALLAAAGFSDVVVDPIDVVYAWPSVPDFITFLKEVAAPLTALISPNPPAVQDEIWAAIASAVAPETGGSAPLRLAAQSSLAAGHVA